MTITISSISQCPGGGHVEIEATVDGKARTLRTSRDELALEDVSLQEQVIVRLRSAIKEAGATAPLQIRNALVGKEFKV